MVKMAEGEDALTAKLVPCRLPAHARPVVLSSYFTSNRGQHFTFLAKLGLDFPVIV